MSSKSKESEASRRKLDVEPRQLPDQHEAAGDPFEQLNAASSPPQVDPSERNLIRPRDLPDRDPAAEMTAGEVETMREAVRLMEEEGHSHEEAAKQLQVEPLQLRRWETAYHEYLQSDLNEGDYHDTDAQLRDLPDNSKERFHDNWEQVLEKQTERRIKVGPTRLKLMQSPFSRWLFKSEHGDLDWGTIIGIVVVLIALVTTLGYLSRSQKQPIAEDEGGIWVDTDFTNINHEPLQAADVVIGFHNATRWEDKLQYVLAPDRVRPLMESWYREHPDQVTYDRLGFVHDQDVEHAGRNFLLFNLQVGKVEESPAKDRPFYMAVERLRDGRYLIDWEVSSGYQEMSLSDFRQQRVTTPKEFRLTIALTDYYNFGYNEQEHVAFSATTLTAEEPLFIYAKRDDPQVQEVMDLLEVRDSMGVIVKLRYPENSKVDNQADLVEVVSTAWFRDYAKN